MSKEKSMQQKIDARLAELRREMEAGREQMASLEARTQELRHTMMRISGAIQVLEEIKASGGDLPAEPEPKT